MVSESSTRAQELESTDVEELKIFKSKIWETECACSGGLR